MCFLVGVMKFLAVLLYTITLPLAFAHPLQSNDHLPTGLQKHAALNGTDLEHDVHLMLKRGINPTCVSYTPRFTNKPLFI